MTDFPDISLDRILGRVRECGDCLEWAGYAVHGKFPQIRVNCVCHPVRRIVWVLVHGPLKSSEVWVGTTCKNPLCVNPDHLIARPRSKAMKGGKRTVSHKTKIAAAKRVKSVLTLESVREIRASDEGNAALGERYGINPGYVSHIRRGTVWKDYVTPFQGLGAR